MSDGSCICCGFGGSGLRVLPFLARAELTGQTAAMLELKPVLDARSAAAAGQRLTLPPSSEVLVSGTQLRLAPAGAQAAFDSTMSRVGVTGVGFGSGTASAAAPSSASRYDLYGFHQLRGSGSKLMTSPGKAMKILPGEGGAGPAGYGFGAMGSSSSRAAWSVRNSAATLATSAATVAGRSGKQYAGSGQAATQPPWTTSVAGYLSGAGAPRESPPMPRSSAVPTPFRCGAAGWVLPRRLPSLLTLIIDTVKFPTQFQCGVIFTIAS